MIKGDVHVKEVLIDSINKKVKVRVEFIDKSKGNEIQSMICIPFDYGPSKTSNDKSDKFQFYDLSSHRGSHILSKLPEAIIDIIQTDLPFEPSDYVKWKPHWIISRDWGDFS